MTNKVYVVTDLGPGDGGKGGVVHKLCTMQRPHTVIKRGGAQGSHGVRTSKGEEFAFSQWGCGTPLGIPTHLTEQMIITPEGLLSEADALRYTLGIDDPFGLLTVDERALCATPFHTVASRLKELARRDNPRGTVGTGVGAAYRLHQRQPELSILAGDLRHPGLRDKLAAIRDAVRLELRSVLDGPFLAADSAERFTLTALLYDDPFLEQVIDSFAKAARRVRVVDSSYLGGVILARQGSAVVETSHGVLTDRLAGFHPHTSAIRTLPRFTQQLLEDAGYRGQVVQLGVSRAYAVRHGAGPLPTNDPEMADRLLPGSHKDDNRYQGKVRVGPLDLVLLRYAIEVCGGPAFFDGLAITCFDQVLADITASVPATSPPGSTSGSPAAGKWLVCDRYEGADNPMFFDPGGSIKPDISDDSLHEMYQQVLGRLLLECRPRFTGIPVDPGAGKDALYAICADTIKASTGVPVRMVSFGPTERDKLCK